MDVAGEGWGARLLSLQQPHGQWPLHAPSFPSAEAGRLHFPLDDGPGKPSRWNTLRALRVLRWYTR